MKLVILESPYAGNRQTNIEYAHRAMLHALSLDESPIASHLLYTQFLDDNHPEQRVLGMRAGLAWYKVAEACVVYKDMGVSQGMSVGISVAKKNNVPVIFREIGMWEGALAHP